LKYFHIALAFLVLSIGASAQQPAIFFTDLTSGPNSGGESVSGFSGAYVTIYGNYFGTTQGSSTVSLNGANCLRVVSWGTTWLWYQKIVVQLGSSCTSGNFVVTVNGQPSTVANTQLDGAPQNPASFTVRSGHIYCVSGSGNDSSSGTFTGGCWASIQKAITSIASGDIAYVKSMNEGDHCAQYNAADCILSSGAAGLLKAIVAYPGATVGYNTTQPTAIRTPLVTGPGPYWLIAGLNMSSTQSNFSYVQGNLRLIGNTLSCPGGNGYTACAEIEGDHNWIYGNEITIAGVVGAVKEYHGVYFSEGDNHTDFGWNSVHNVRGCRGVQFYSSQGNNMYDLHVHDNLIHDTVCDGINFASQNPGLGPVEAFNNVLYNVGIGPTPPDGGSSYTCFNNTAFGTVTVPIQIYNNTCYNAGSSSIAGSTSVGGVAAYSPVTLKNNLFYQTNGFPYITADAGCSQYTGGTKNDFYGNGAPPSCSGIASSLNVNPQVASTSTYNFQLLSSSPLLGAGTAALFPLLDHTGLPQASPPAIGGYNIAGSGATRPQPPSNLQVTVQ
jgi:hypothetical protein